MHIVIFFFNKTETVFECSRAAVTSHDTIDGHSFCTVDDFRDHDNKHGKYWIREWEDTWYGETTNCVYVCNLYMCFAFWRSVCYTDTIFSACYSFSRLKPGSICTEYREKIRCRKWPTSLVKMRGSSRGPSTFRRERESRETGFPLRRKPESNSTVNPSPHFCIVYKDKNT